MAETGLAEALADVEKILDAHPDELVIRRTGSTWSVSSRLAACTDDTLELALVGWYMAILEVIE
jgi:hypothetical protein